MHTMSELFDYVSEKAKRYVEENGDEIKTFPSSIVDFVIEYISNNCHFPKQFSEDRIVEDLQKGKNAIAMACVDIYSKAGAEGEISHSENGTSRAYKSAWITFDLISNFPNYVNMF